MAVVKIGQIKSTPGKALAYVTRPDATQDGVWISTNAAVLDAGDWKAIAREFASTTERVGVMKQREGSVLAHHVIQSFKPGERVTAEQAHELGVQLAEKITGGRYEYVIATHLDKGHVHNHIIFNATNMETGRKFRCQKDTIGKIRELSDGLCRSAGLSVLPPPQRATGRSFGDIYRVLRGQSAKEMLRVEIDKAAGKAGSWSEFERRLELAGIETRRGGGVNGTVSFREESMGRAVRDWRLGEAYTESSIMARLSRSAVNRISVDASMVVAETRQTMTIYVPGTHRRLRMTVAKRQVVRHGRSVRIYVPAEKRHVLADAKGNLAATVSTQGLYKWFTEPDLTGVSRPQQMNAGDRSELRTWSDALRGLHDLEARINAKARWLNRGSGDVEGALVDAKRRLEETRLNFETRLVAASDLAANGDDAGNLAVLKAELRMTEREIAQLKNDVSALTVLTREESRMSVADKIEKGVAAKRRAEALQVERVAQRERYADQEGDRETPAHRIARENEDDAQEVRIEDQRRDRDRGTGRDTGMSLGERIEAEVRRRRATRSTPIDSADDRGGRSR